MEHLTGWPIAKATTSSTSETVMDFMRDEFMFHFVPPMTAVSDNVTILRREKLSSYMSNHCIDWKTVLEYAPMSNGCAERMVGRSTERRRKLF